jgi:Leucine-rich repeat (LRR) protein
MKGTPSQRQNIKFLELPDNQLTHVNFICSNFPNLTKLILSRNKIADIEQVGTLENLE